METSLSYLISSSTMKSPSQHAHAACPLLESSAAVCSLSPHPLPFAILCESSKHFYAFLLPLSGPKRCAGVGAAAVFPCSFPNKCFLLLAAVIVRGSRSAGISSAGSAAVLCASAWLTHYCCSPAISAAEAAWETAATSRAPASYSGAWLSPLQGEMGQARRNGAASGSLGVCLSTGVCCWMEVAGTRGPRSLWVAESRCRASKARGLGHSQGLGEGHRWSLAFTQGSVWCQLCCERQPR